MSPSKPSSGAAKSEGAAMVAAASGLATTNLADEERQQNEIWFREDEGWELTWPIWHMLPRDERKALALKHGCKTIGEFEEYMTLQRGITDSATASQPYENNLVYPEYHPSGEERHDDEKIPATLAVEEDVDSEDEELEEAIRTQQEAAQERISTEELMNVGGKILMLPDELLHKVFAWLPVDAYATLALVSPHWKAFTRTEAVYRRLCERLYLVQSKRKALHVHRFNNSYRTMLEKRPRVRAGGGVYVMKYTKVKPVQRDMWTEVRLCFQGIVGIVIVRFCTDFHLLPISFVDPNWSDLGDGVLSIPLLSRRWAGFVCTHVGGASRNVSSLAQDVPSRDGVHGSSCRLGNVYNTEDPRDSECTSTVATRSTQNDHPTSVPFAWPMGLPFV